MSYPILYSFKRCPYAMRARMALHLAEIKCEIREIRLSNKPEQMLEVSPKGTVPILILEDKVIDESYDIVNWVIEESNIFDGNLDSDQIDLTESLIKKFDDEFKHHLDRYKYATRSEDVDEILHRESCVEILKTMEKIISNNKFFYTNHVNKIDICILPFIRQFRIANPEWFDRQNEFPKVQKWLDSFLKSSILEEIMVSHEVWKKDNPAIFFPTNL